MLELHDGDKGRLFGKGVLEAVANVIDKIEPKFPGMDVSKQADIDRALAEELEGTEN